MDVWPVLLAASEEMTVQCTDSRQQTADIRQQTADSRQQTADSRQQTAETGQQTADSRQNAADSRQQTERVILAAGEEMTVQRTDSTSRFFRSGILHVVEIGAHML